MFYSASQKRDAHKKIPCVEQTSDEHGESSCSFALGRARAGRGIFEVYPTRAYS